MALPTGWVSILMLSWMLILCSAEIGSYTTVWLDPVTQDLDGPSPQGKINIHCHSRHHLAGHLKLKHYPKQNFTSRVTVVTERCSRYSPYGTYEDQNGTTVWGPCYDGLTKFAMYFNVRTLNLRAGDSIVIIENGEIAKTYDADTIQQNDPQSYDQFRSSYSQTPMIDIQFIKSPESQWLGGGEINTVRLDYIILQESKCQSESYFENSKFVERVLCPSLKGTMPKDLFCDNTDDDRVNCPDFYMDTTSPYPVGSKFPSFISDQYSPFYCPLIDATTANPWDSDQTTSPDGDVTPTADYCWSWPWPCPEATTRKPTHHRHHVSGLSSFALASIILGSIALVAILIFVILRVCCTRSARSTSVMTYQRQVNAAPTKAELAASYAAHGPMAPLAVPSPANFVGKPAGYFAPVIYPTSQMNGNQSIA